MVLELQRDKLHNLILVQPRRRMASAKLSQLSETAQILLGAFALTDVHTLSADDVEILSNGVVSTAAAKSALVELSQAGLAEAQTEAPQDAYRLTRSGIELTLQMQQALARREGMAGTGTKE